MKIEPPDDNAAGDNGPYIQPDIQIKQEKDEVKSEPELNINDHQIQMDSFPWEMKQEPKDDGTEESKQLYLATENIIDTKQEEELIIVDNQVQDIDLEENYEDMYEDCLKKKNSFCESVGALAFDKSGSSDGSDGSDQKKTSQLVGPHQRDCRFGDRTKEVNVKRHATRREQDKTYHCTICAYSNKRASKLKRHMYTHTGTKPYKCNLCSYSCIENSKLKEHINTHTGTKSYKCSLCSYTARTASHLKNHMYTHCGTKPYKCNLCSYSCSGNLKRHMATHNGTKPYKCSLCSYSCSQSGEMKRHMIRHSSSKPFQCDHCGLVCKWRKSLVRHILRKHSDLKPFNCAHCSYKAALKQDLVEHLKKHNGTT